MKNTDEAWIKEFEKLGKLMKQTSLTLEQKTILKSFIRNLLKTKEQEVAEDLVKERFNIATWMRDNQGIDDDDTFTAEEIEETLECYFDYIKAKYLTKKDRRGE